MTPRRAGTSPPPPSLVWKTLKLLCWTGAPLGITAFAPVVFRQVQSGLLENHTCQLVALGCAAGCLVWAVLGRLVPFYEVFIHELTHLVAGILFLKKPRRIMASDEGGQVDLYGGNFIISLAPYCVPLLPLGLIALWPALNPAYHTWYCLLLGFLCGTYLVSVVRQFRLHQPDLQEAGRVFSILFCAVVNLILLAGLLGFAADGPAGAFAALRDGLIQARVTVTRLAALCEPGMSAARDVLRDLMP